MLRCRFIQGEDVSILEKEFDLGVPQAQKRVEIPRDTQIQPQNDDALASRAQLAALAAELDLSPTTLRQTLETAMAFDFRFPVFRDEGSTTRVRFSTEVPRRGKRLWTIQCGRRAPGVARSNFRPRLFHRHPREWPPSFSTQARHASPPLAHPVFLQTFATFARLRFQGRRTPALDCAPGGVPAGADAVLLFTVEELAVNDLRETFHHWSRTLALPVKGRTLGQLLHTKAPKSGAAALPVLPSFPLSAFRVFFHPLTRATAAPT